MTSPEIIAIVSVLPFLVRILYLGKFRYKTRLYQPLEYPVAKRFLGRITIAFLTGGAIAIYFLASLFWAATLLAACFVVDHLVKFYARQRAVTTLSAILQNIPPEDRDRIALRAVGRDIENGDLV
ncbi:MAG: hypothetical protein ABSG54_17045 [Terriglobia bacterium]